MNIKRNYFVGFDTLLTVILITALLTACGGGSGSTTTTSPTATNTTTTTSSSGQTGRGSAALTSIPSATGNSVSLIVDSGPVSGSPSINVPYVSVTVCTPGTSGSTAACQTIDHVTLDTGSYGLRLLNSSLSSNLNLPAATTNGKTIGECVQFVVGTTWGSVRLADIYIGGEVAKNVPIQDIGDAPGGATGIPTDCSNTGTIQDTQATLGSNGILGVGIFVNDCDACLTQALSAAYYTCTSSGCANSTVTSSQVVRNPVASFAQDNNGTLISLPAVSSAGATTLSGSLIFGIGTQTNNAIPATASVYTTDSYGNFSTTYKGVNMTRSYLDSGSNGLFFYDSTIAVNVANGWYIPATPLSLSATNTSVSGSPSLAVPFTLVTADKLALNIVAANIGGRGSTGTFAWGLPFYFGRPVFTAIANMRVTGVPTGPYWAY